MKIFSEIEESGIIKLARNGNSLVFHVPRPVAAQLGLRRNDLFRLRVVNGTLIFRPLQSILDAGEKALAAEDEKVAELVNA